MSRFTKAIAVAVLIMTVGLHWAFLQSLAWATMFVRYSQQSTVKIALIQTFDGKHPCALCEFVAKGATENKKSKEKKLEVKKFELLIEPSVAYQFRPRQPILLGSFPAAHLGRQEEPPTPPPRFA